MNRRYLITICVNCFGLRAFFLAGGSRNAVLVYMIQALRKLKKKMARSSKRERAQLYSGVIVINQCAAIKLEEAMLRSGRK